MKTICSGTSTQTGLPLLMFLCVFLLLPGCGNDATDKKKNKNRDKNKTETRTEETNSHEDNIRETVKNFSSSLANNRLEESIKYLVKEEQEKASVQEKTIKIDKGDSGVFTIREKGSSFVKMSPVIMDIDRKEDRATVRVRSNSAASASDSGMDSISLISMKKESGDWRIDFQDTMAKTLKFRMKQNRKKGKPIGTGSWKKETVAGYGTLTDLLFLNGGSRFLTTSADGGIRIWNASSGNNPTLFGRAVEEIQTAALSSQGNRLVTLAGDAITVWDLDTKKTVGRLQKNSSPTGGMANFGKLTTSVDISPDGQTVASGHGNLQKSGRVAVWNVTKEKLQTSLDAFSAPVEDVTFSNNGRYLAASSPDKQIKIWSTDDFRLIQTLKARGQTLRFCSGGTLLAARKGGTIHLFKTKTGEKKGTLQGARSFMLNDMSVSPDGSTLATADQDQIRLLNVKNKTETTVLKTGGIPIRSVSFSPDGKHIAAGTGEIIFLWNLEKPENPEKITGHTGEVISLAVSPDGSTLATAHGKGNDRPVIRIWNRSTGELTTTFLTHDEPVLVLKYTPDGNKLVSGSRDGTIGIYNTKNWKLEHQFRNRYSDVVDLEIFPNSRRMVTADLENHLKIRSLTEDKILQEWSTTYENQPKHDHINSVAISPDGTRIATGSGFSGKHPGRLQLWSAEDGSRLHQFKQQKQVVRHVEFLKNPNQLFTADRRALKVWDISKKKPVATLSSSPLAARFLPDGTHLVYSGAGRVTVQNWKSGDVTAILPMPGRTIMAIALSAKATVLASGMNNGTVSIWTRSD